MSVRVRFSFVIALLLSNVASASSIEAVESDFSISEVPVYKTHEKLMCAATDRDTWSVVSSDSGVKIRAFEGGEPKNYALQKEVVLGNSKLVAIDKGEFGGSVEWREEKKKAVRVYFGMPVKGFLVSGTRYFAFMGLAHMNRDKGAIFELIRKGEHWNKRKLIELGTNPIVVQRVSDREVIIASPTGLYQYELGGVLKNLHVSPEWRGLYQNSVVIAPSGTIYVGMRHAVARLTPSKEGYSETWLVKNPCPITK